MEGNQKQLNEKLETHKCQFCFVEFSTKYTCTRHESSCKSNNNSTCKQFKCPHCEKVYSRKDKLNAHVKKCTISSSKELLASSHESPNAETSNQLEGDIEGQLNKDIPTYQCKTCLSKFTNKYNCSRHENYCKSNNSSSNRFKCTNCEAILNRKDNLDVHFKKCSSRNSLKTNDTNQPQTSSEDLTNTSKPNKHNSRCLVGECQLTFYHKISLINHLKNDHQNYVTIKEKMYKQFSSFQEFLSWKETEEESTFSYFSRKCGNKSYYYCQHDGPQNLHKKNKTNRTNLKGKVKVGHQCIAKMKVWSSDEKVHVEYYPTHNHRCVPEDFVHHPVPDSISQYIDNQLAEQVSPSKIHSKIRDAYVKKDTENVENLKINTLTKKTLRERSRKRRNAKRLHEDDATAVYLLAEQKKKEDSVLIYKPYGGKVVVGPEEINHLPNADDLFLFGMQTQRQLDIMKKYCSQILVVDETHGTNQYKFKLLTCLVVDNNRRGWPVAHLITSKSDSETFKFFFSALKDRLGGEKINCVITDDDLAILNGMNQGFSPDLRHILCQWHVIKAWKENLRQKVRKEDRDTLFDELRTIMSESNENQFYDLLGGFQKKYETNEQIFPFIDYFNQQYLLRPEKWANCYRAFFHGEVNTTGHLESFHNRLKTTYLKRKVNKRLDDLIGILYNIEWDDHCFRMRQTNYKSTSMPKEIIERHKNGLEIQDAAVVKIFNNTYGISSTKNNQVRYLVTKHEKCNNPDHCFCRCSNLLCKGLCSHLYVCTCPDRHPLCKHIHKVHLFHTSQSTQNLVEDSEFYSLGEAGPETNDNETKRNANLPTSFEATRLLEKMKNHLQIANTFYTSAAANNESKHNIVMIEASLSELANLIENTKKKPEDKLPISMKPTEVFTSTQQLKTQSSQLLPFKRPSKRKLKIPLAQLAQKKKRVSEELLEYNKQ